MAIEDILMNDESLFSNINAFDPDYIPHNFNYRDTQMQAMALAIRPAINGGQPSNSTILGSCATGKTTAIKKVFELVEKNTMDVICVYINCQLHTTRFGIFSQIYKKIFGHLPPETGVPFSRIYSKIMEHLQKNQIALIVALDDVNYLFQNKTANKVFYDILRAYEEYPGVRSAIFATLSDLEFKYAFDKNVNTVFIPQDITFSPYTYSEIHNILNDRVKAGFHPNVMPDEILEQISNYTYEKGDLRAGINLLKSVGNIAESQASKIIQQEHYNKAINSQTPTPLLQTLKSLSPLEKSLLEIIINSDKILNAGEASDLFIKKENVSYASFNRILEKLEFLRLIDTPFTGEGVRGNSRKLILRFNPEDYNYI